MKTIHKVMWLIYKHIEFGEVDTAEKVLKDYGDSIVDECAEKASLDYGEDDSEYWIDKDSILQVKEQIK